VNFVDGTALQNKVNLIKLQVNLAGQVFLHCHIILQYWTNRRSSLKVASTILAQYLAKARFRRSITSFVRGRQCLCCCCFILWTSDLRPWPSSLT